jgi:uncharacterized phosphosugar-binding protein
MKSHEYFNALKDLLNRIESEQMLKIRDAGLLVSSAVADQGVLHVFGSGHSHMMAEEAFFRAGGLVPVNAILDERLAFFSGAYESTLREREPGYAQTILSRENIQSKDVAIVVSNSGRNAVPIEMALELQYRGLTVIAITNVQQSMRSSSRHASGKRLCDIADIVIDNCVAPGDAALDLPGTPYRIGPTSTVAGATIINAIIIEAAVELQRLGLPVPIFPSANVESHSADNLESLLALWSPQVRLFRNSSD